MKEGKEDDFGVNFRKLEIDSQKRKRLSGAKLKSQINREVYMHEMSFHAPTVTTLAEEESKVAAKIRDDAAAENITRESRGDGVPFPEKMRGKPLEQNLFNATSNAEFIKAQMEKTKLTPASKANLEKAKSKLEAARQAIIDSWGKK